MKKSKLAAGVAALAVSLSTLSAPHVLAHEPGTKPVTQAEKEQGAPEMSFATSDGAEILPEETITFTADEWEEGIEVRNAYIEIAPGETSPLWDVDHGLNEEGAPYVTVTAPTTPDEQYTASPQEYGEYLVHVRTSNWNSVYFDINFVEERTPEPVEPEEPDFWEQLQELSSGLSSFR